MVDISSLFFKARKTYKVVQILKRNVMEEPHESDSNDQNETHTKTMKSLFATLIKRKRTKTSETEITKKIEASLYESETSSEVEEEGQFPHPRSTKCILPNSDSDVKLFQTIQTILKPKFKISYEDSKHKHYNFFKKLLKSSKSGENQTVSSTSGQHDNSDQNSEKLGLNLGLNNQSLSYIRNFFPTSYTYFDFYFCKIFTFITFQAQTRLKVD